MAPGNNANLEAVLDQLERNVAAAFRRAMNDVKDDTDLANLSLAIQSRDVATVLEVLRVDPAYFSALDRAIDIAYYEGATSEGNLINEQLGTAATFRFDGRHRRAEHWTQEHGGNLVTKVSNETRDVIREFVREGIAAGKGPRDIAADLIGRRYGGERQGGIIGLTPGQARYVSNMRAELEGGALANYFTRQARDRRYDKAVEEAQTTGKPISAGLIDRIVDKYADNLLVLRGETIARTEAIGAYNAGRFESTAQLVESGKVPRAAITLIWDATLSKRTRDSHLMLNGKEIVFGAMFQSPVTGGLMRFPGDTGLGAPGSETINCRCTFRTRIDRKQLATKKPRGRPVGSRNKEKDPEPQPQPPVAPPAPPQASPAPVPAPPPEPETQFTYEAFTVAKTQEALNAFLQAARVAYRVALGGYTLKQQSRVARAAAEVRERFDTGPLNYLGTPIAGRKKPKGAGGWYYPGRGELIVAPKSFSQSDTNNSVAAGDVWADKNYPIHQASVAANTLIPEHIKAIVARMESWTWLAEPRANEDKRLEYVLYHEMGHFLEDVYGSEMSRVVARDGRGLPVYRVALSHYGSTSFSEFIVESFALYMMGDETQFYRLDPGLLEFFRSKDKRRLTP